MAAGPAVYEVGAFAPAGFWVETADALLISGDAGATWSAGTLPRSATVSVPPTTFLDVLDASHAWALTADDLGTGVSGDVTRDKLALTIHRSTDGGRTWADIPIIGNYPDSLQALHFLDADQGYLLISPRRFDIQTSTLLRTSDGGLTWRVAGTDGWLGTDLATPDASTIWAASAGDAGPVMRRIFAVSRDGGRTWRDAPLPGVPGTVGQGASFLQPPVFIGATGVALVAHNDGSGLADIDRSDDAGKHWTRVSTTDASSLAVLTQTSWLRPGPTPGTIEATTDGGLTWQPLAASGLPAAPVSWLGFSDASHGALTVAIGESSAAGLYVSADGGSTWRAADLTATSVTQATPSSPRPTLTDEGMPVLDIPPAASRIAPIPDSPAVQAGAAPTGPYAYLRGIAGKTLFVADAGGGSERQVSLALLADERIDEVLTDRSSIVVAVSRAATTGAAESQLSCKQLERQPRAWRILAAPLGADGLPRVSFRQIDAGVASRPFELPQSAGLACPYPATPPVALAASRVAYAVEAATGAASTVVVRSLPDGSLVRSYASPSRVYQVAVSNTAVAWSETANGLTDGQTPDWRVMTASTMAGAPRQVPLGVVAGPRHAFPPSLLLDGDALIASLDQFAGESGTVVRADGDQIETVDRGRAHRDCGAAGADGGVIVLYCNGTTMSGNTATMTSWVAAWSAASGLRALGGGVTIAPGDLWTDNGWAMWTGVDAHQHSVLVGVLLSALR